MSDNKPNCLNDGSIWCRIGYTALFGLIYSMADMVLVILVITQFCFLVFSGDKNKELARFGQQVSDYLYAILRFLTFNSDERPFPFAEWPKTPQGSPETSPEPPAPAPEPTEPPVSKDTVTEEVESAEVIPEKPPAPAKKKASKKKTTRKKAATRKKSTTKKVSSASKQKEDNDS